MSRCKVMLVAGEASGDQHAASLVRALKNLCPDVQCFGLGGDMMAQAGVEVVQRLVSHAVIGVAEALRKLGDFFNILKLTKHLLQQYHPHVLVLVDFPDMNLRIAAQAKKLGIPVVYYISPQVWAWRAGRVKTMKRLVDHIVVILPFEEPIYQQAGIPVTYAGHPLLDSIQPEEDVSHIRQRLLQGQAGPLIALVPGSRYQEIELMLPIMLEVGQRILLHFPTAHFFIPLARTVAREQVERYLKAAGFVAELVEDHPMAARAAADLAIVASGTATLETAVLGVPMIIGYRMHWFSYLIARWFVKLPYFGLANLVAGKMIAPEFLQDAFHPEKVSRVACELLSHSDLAEQQRQAWQQVRERLGRPGAAQRAAEVVARFLPVPQ